MPASHTDNESVSPLRNTVGVPLIMHISKRLEAPAFLVEYRCRLKVSLRVNDRATSPINLATDLDALMIPRRLKIFVLNQALVLFHAQQVEHDDIVRVKEVQTC